MLMRECCSCRENLLLCCAAFLESCVSGYYSATSKGKKRKAMAQFAAGDDLIFQLESGYGLLRVLAVEEDATDAAAVVVWHILVYEELFPDAETAEAALASPETLHARVAHLALTGRAFERTPAARLGQRPLTEEELAAYRKWVAQGAGEVFDRSVLLMLGLR